MTAPRVAIGLSAVIVAATEENPLVVVTRGADYAGLPFGPFDPVGDRTLELSLRRWVSEQTGFDIGYVEQLYTFGDRGREAPLDDLDSIETAAARVMSIGYLALTPSRAALEADRALWRSWYEFFPWEDWRGGRPRAIDAEIAPRLTAWADAGETPVVREARRTRARLAFALGGAGWNEERALDRYELLYEAGVAPEAARDRARFSRRPEAPAPALPAIFGEPMLSDHRRILATAVSRLRAKIKYRPVIFELAPPAFTLLHLQRIVEAIAGLSLHKQNFRRLLARTGLVEPAGAYDATAGGRPAEIYRPNLATLAARPTMGVHVPAPRGGEPRPRRPADPRD
ncbi:MAG: NAD regulator [Alphaproteobacteria bacterium]|nr:NAD regulator [Alphaproteobacteria bacterium]